jgi:hypothetical protein
MHSWSSKPPPSFHSLLLPNSWLCPPFHDPHPSPATFASHLHRLPRPLGASPVFHCVLAQLLKCTSPETSFHTYHLHPPPRTCSVLCAAVMAGCWLSHLSVYHQLFYPMHTGRNLGPLRAGTSDILFLQDPHTQPKATGKMFKADGERADWE